MKLIRLNKHFLHFTPVNKQQLDESQEMLNLEKHVLIKTSKTIKGMLYAKGALTLRHDLKKYAIFWQDFTTM